MSEIISIILILSGVLLGIFGILISLINLPGLIVLWFGILLMAIGEGFDRIGGAFLLTSLLVALLASLLDNFLVPLATQKFGGTRWGIVGAIIGGVFGLVIGNLVGILIGPFIGATVAELLFAGKDGRSALKAGAGTFFGLALAIALKFGVAVSLLILAISRLF